MLTAQAQPCRADKSLVTTERPVTVQFRDLTSPELALVDPVLGESARSSLPRTGDTLARIELLVGTPRVKASREQCVVDEASRGTSSARPTQSTGRNTHIASRPPDSSHTNQTDLELMARRRATGGSDAALRNLTEPHAYPAPEPSRGRLRVAVRLAAATAVLGTSAVLTSNLTTHHPPSAAETTQVDASNHPEEPATVAQNNVGMTTKTATQAAAHHPRVSEQPRVSASSRNRKPSNDRTHAAAVTLSSRRLLAWPRTPGSTGYHVELYRAGTRMFSANVRKSRFVIPIAFGSGASRRQLEHGEYRCYVWAAISGHSSSEVIVQAKLVL
jgi:hypothetical protein